MRVIKSPASFRSWLLALAAAGLSASLIVAAMIGWWSWQDQKARIGASLAATSRAILESVDRELDRAVALARGLSVSRLLADGDLAGFEQQARQAIAPYGYNLILKSPKSEHQLLNTQVPPGTEPPKLTIEPIDPEVRQGKVRIARLRQSRISGLWLTTIDVPVFEPGGQLQCVISVLVPSVAFQRIIDDQKLPASWSPVILDGDWTVVARDASRARFLGEKGAAQVFQFTADGLHEVRLLDGDRALSSHSHSQRYGWTVAVAIPKATMLVDALRPIVAGAAGGFAVAALAIGGVLVFAARMGAGVRALARATRALGKGKRVELPRFFVSELTSVAEGMQQAAAEIAASRQELERRIASATAELRRETEERRKAEVDLAHAQRVEAVGLLTGGVAHDFNNLLTVIYGQVELIARAAQGNERIERMAAAALRAVERGAHLANQLLAFAGRQELRPVTLAVDGLLQGIAELARRTIGESITVDVALDPDLWRLHVDPTQFESAILNLAINARDAMPEGGHLAIAAVNVRLSEEERRRLGLAPVDYVAVSVIDSGVGMPPDILVRAFEPFYTTKDVGKGTGLGLSQVYGFAKQSGGTAAIESAPGKGTKVVLYLPRASGSIELDARPPKEQSHPSIKGTRVLLVEDQAEVRDAIEAMLVDLGLTVLTAKDGVAARKVLDSSETIDLLLTDVLMPHAVSGLALARDARKLRPDLKIIVVSGHLRQAHQDLRDIPGAIFLEKPFRPSQLAEAIAAALA